MTKHPWMRAPSLAASLGLIMGAMGIVIAGFQMGAGYLKTIFITLGFVFIFLLTLLFILLLYLFFRDYGDLYPKFTRNILGIRY